MDDPRRWIPRTDHVLAEPPVRAAAARLGDRLVKDLVRGVLQRCRDGELKPDDVVATIVAELPPAATGMRAVINGTGIIVHTNLGRAPLSPAARSAIDVAAGATNVELDLTSGRRAKRGQSAVDALERAVPVAGGAHVVNNGAAALTLAARALAPEGNIVLSRGEMVEIGDGFRIPELLESVGTRIREVGTTNRVRFDDYRDAIDENTGFVLKVHTSNFTVRGFTAEVPVSQLSGLDVPVVADIGSGLLTRHPRLPHEPDVTTALNDGAALVIASGDKLFGGPQAGLIFGRQAVVERLRRHPFARALRVDKLTLAALEASVAGPQPPVAAALSRDVAALRARAEHIVSAVGAHIPARVVESNAAVGGGGAPGVDLDSAAVALPAAFAGALRTPGSHAIPAVMAHVERDRTLIDLIAVDPEDDQRVIDAIIAAAAETSHT